MVYNNAIRKCLDVVGGAGKENSSQEIAATRTKS